MFPSPSCYNVSNHKPKKGKDNSSLIKNPSYGKCGKKDYCNCLKGTDNCFCCGKSAHNVKYFPNVRGKHKGSGKVQASVSNEGPKKNHFYAPL